MKRIFVAAILAAVCFQISGCAKKKNDEPKAVEYMAGKPQLDAYKKTRSKVQDINKTLEDRYEGLE